MRAILLLACTLVLGGCGLVYRMEVQQGNYVTHESAARLKQGMSKAEVRQVLGTPLLADVFHADQWDYYFSQVKGGKAADRTRFTVTFKDDKLVAWTGATRAKEEQATSGLSEPRARLPFMR